MIDDNKKSPLMLAHEKGSSPENQVRFQDHHNKAVSSCQSVHTNVFTKTERELSDKFAPKKGSSLLLSESYRRLGQESKSFRVEDCGSFLEFAYPLTKDGEISADSGKLHNANFCRDRMCPMCGWRRSYKIYGQVSRIMDSIGDQYKYLFLTLTIPNCTAETLPDTLDSLMASFRRFSHYKRLKVVKGFFRALEITRNKDNGSYHPHFHCILAVPKNYGGGKDYIKRDEWLSLWQRACRDSSITQVDIRLVKPKASLSASASDAPSERLASAVAEIAKYPLKDNEYLIPDNTELTDEIVSTLSSALFHRRLVAFGGCFKEIFNSLALDDPEEGDLIHLDESINDSLSLLIVKYGWSCGIYKIIDSRYEHGKDVIHV